MSGRSECSEAASSALPTGRHGMIVQSCLQCMAARSFRTVQFSSSLRGSACAEHSAKLAMTRGCGGVGTAVRVAARKSQAQLQMDSSHHVELVVMLSGSTMAGDLQRVIFSVLTVYSSHTGLISGGVAALGNPRGARPIAPS
jgi:hypothetical protein